MKASKTMPRERHYQCKKCSHKWWEPVNDSHDVFCPNEHCESFVNYARKSHASNSHIGNVSKAAEITSQMLERDYGIPPSMQVDNARQGDAYVKMPARAMPQPMYMENGGGSKEVVENFLGAGAASGGLGPSGNLTGLDVISAAKSTGSIVNPIRNGTFYGTKDK